MHGDLDLPLRGRNPRQQIRAQRLRFPLPHRLDMHAHALLLDPGLHRREAGIRGGHANLSGHLPGVSDMGDPKPLKFNPLNAMLIPPPPLNSCILPIGLLFAGTLWSSNAAYLYLSVSFIQMLKVHGAAWGMECTEQAPGDQISQTQLKAACWMT